MESSFISIGLLKFKLKIRFRDELDFWFCGTSTSGNRASRQPMASPVSNKNKRKSYFFLLSVSIVYKIPHRPLLNQYAIIFKLSKLLDLFINLFYSFKWIACSLRFVGGTICKFHSRFFEDEFLCVLIDGYVLFQ